MAKPKRKRGHVRLTCPHCGRSVSVQRPHRFQPAMPCPNCRVPINADLIIATESAQAATSGQEGGEAPEQKTDGADEQAGA